MISSRSAATSARRDRSSSRTVATSSVWGVAGSPSESGRPPVSSSSAEQRRERRGHRSQYCDAGEHDEDGRHPPDACFGHEIAVPDGGHRHDAPPQRVAEGLEAVLVVLGPLDDRGCDDEDDRHIEERLPQSKLTRQGLKDIKQPSHPLLSFLETDSFC